MLRMLASQAWAITPEGLEGVRRLLAEEDFDMDPMAPEDEEEQAEGVAIIRVCGPIVPRGNWLTRVRQG